MVANKGKARTLGYVPCFDCELNGPDKKPSFRVKIDTQGVGKLIELLQAHRSERGRGWVIITVTDNDLSRLRLVTGMTPGFEDGASDVYLRGEIFRANPTNRSCNITFSEQNGTGSLVSRLQIASERMRRFLEIRIPNRRREKDLIEFISDTELEALESIEHEKLAQTGSALTADVWENEDFSDWESQDD